MSQLGYSHYRTNVVILNKDLEDEVESLGWQRKKDVNGNKEKLSPEKAYRFIYELITQNNGKSKIESSPFWNIIQLSMKK